MLSCCKAYISESQNRAVLEPSEKAKELYRGMAVVNKLEDEAYNRFLMMMMMKQTTLAVSDNKDELRVHKERKGRDLDAVLTCPACFTTLCSECQRLQSCIHISRGLYIVHRQLQDQD
ncbi:hypothetical protein MKX01_005007 [Papaver californicum]|nr:hypothetical protein MKX01_005007 [Papaver californicum]